MKTNQTMTMYIMGEKVTGEHKSQLVDLNDIFHIGNEQRKTKGAGVAVMKNYFANDATQRYIDSACKAWGLTRETMLPKPARGRHATTKVHIAIAVHAAEYLDSDVHAHVIKCFITDRIFEWRDESGDNYIALSEHIDKYMGGREDKCSNTGVYINAAKRIRAKLLNGSEPSWNSATATQLRQRNKLEQDLCAVLKAGVVNSMDDLYTFIDKL